MTLTPIASFNNSRADTLAISGVEDAVKAMAKDISEEIGKRLAAFESQSDTESITEARSDHTLRRCETMDSHSFVDLAESPQLDQIVCRGVGRILTWGFLDICA